jgi:hypothetical protein
VKRKRKAITDLESVLREKLMNTYLQDVEDEIDLKKTLRCENFKKITNCQKLFDIKKFVEKWYGREQNDLRQKIEMRRQQTITKLKTYQSLIQEMKQIQ